MTAIQWLSTTPETCIPSLWNPSVSVADNLHIESQVVRHTRSTCYNVRVVSGVAFEYTLFHNMSVDHVSFEDLKSSGNIH